MTTPPVVTARVRVPVPGASPLEVEGGDAEASVFARIAEVGGYSTGTMTLLARLVGAGDVVLDVGANVGIMSMALARMVPGVEIHAFEASPRAAHWLAHNVARNGTLGVHATHAAVADRPGVVRFTDDAGFSMGNRIDDAGDVAVPAVSIDGWAKEQLTRQLGLVKIDVEGAEFAVLEGARQTLWAHRPDVLIEVNPTALAQVDGRGARDLWDVLHEWYPHIYWVARAGGVVRLPDAEGLMRMLRRHGLGDVLCRTRPIRSRGLRARVAAALERLPRRGPQYAVEPALTLRGGELPALFPGATVTLPVTVANGTGARLESRGTHPVYLASRWFPEDGSGPIEGQRTPLDGPLGPGESRRLAAVGHLPPPGAYEWRIALVQEGHAWLDAMGPDAAISHRVVIDG